MSGTKKPSLILRQSSQNSLHFNPLNDPKHSRSCSEGGRNNHSVSLGLHMRQNPVSVSDDKENAVPKKSKDCASFDDKENAVPRNEGRKLPDGRVYLRDRALKPSSLQLCMKQNEPDSSFGDDDKFWEAFDSGGGKENVNVNVWDLSDSDAAPASSWSTLPNRVLLCRPLPVDIGRCTCVIVKEALPEGLHGGTLYSLYTNEGKGRQNRKLAMAHHRRRNGKSEFILAQKLKGILCSSDDSFLGTVTSNIMGTKYHIWDQPVSSSTSPTKPPLSVVSFVPTLATWTGSYRRMRVWILKHHSMVLKNVAQVQHVAGLPKDWEEKADKVQQLYSRIPHYNNVSKQYELDFRDRARGGGVKIQSSVKNFQLILEKNGRQTILQLGRVGKSNYVMDYRYPMTGFQAFSTCLASIDTKLCCAM